ncbi:hypothetical protein ACWGJX_45795 [Streptomyces sp. NPDC054775]
MTHATPRKGAMVGVCSLRAQDSDGIPCTTDPDELVAWTQDLGQVTVFATYAAVGLGILQRAHAAGLAVWDLMVIDEAQRISGDAGKPWAAVHDQEKVPAVRRLYMTATARIWEAEGEVPRLIASMDEDSPVFGPVAYKLKLSEAIRRGLVAPYQVVCLDIRDPDLYHALMQGALASDAVRGAWLAALQTGLLTAAVKEKLRRILTAVSAKPRPWPQASWVWRRGCGWRVRAGSRRWSVCGRTGCAASTRLATVAGCWRSLHPTSLSPKGGRGRIFRLRYGS